jgi:hypothetical protein
MVVVLWHRGVGCERRSKALRRRWSRSRAVLADRRSDLGDCHAAGGVECAERVIDLASELFVPERVADLAAGQAGRVCGEGGVDPFGAWLAGRPVQSVPRRRSGQRSPGARARRGGAMG